jgi:hypothetical protein
MNGCCYSRSVVFHLLIVIAVGCDYSPHVAVSERRGIEYGTPQLGAAFAQEKYIRSTEYFFEGYPDDCKWYVSISYNVMMDDERTDRELLTQSVKETQNTLLPEIGKVIATKGGQVSFAEFLVYRDSNDPETPSRYTSGVIIWLPDLMGQPIALDVLDRLVVYKDPVVSDPAYPNWCHRMIMEHAAGLFTHEKTEDR